MWQSATVTHPLRLSHGQPAVTIQLVTQSAEPHSRPRRMRTIRILLNKELYLQLN